MHASSRAESSIATAQRGNAVVSLLVTTLDDTRLFVKPVTVTDPATPGSASDTGANKTTPIVVAKISRVLIVLDGFPRAKARGASGSVKRIGNHLDLSFAIRRSLL